MLAWPGPPRITKIFAEDISMTKQMTIGFIGLGVMGEPMCRNLARKSGAAVVAFDRRAEPLAALARDSVGAAGSAGEVLGRADLIFMCLTGEPQVRGVALGPDGLAAHVREG